MRETIKSQFRWYAGYRGDHICKECKFCIRQQCGNRAHYKCKKMGISSSAATDINLKDCACNFFEEEKQ